jgi:hypothetical protein
VIVGGKVLREEEEERMMMGRFVRGVGSCGDKMCRTGRTGSTEQVVGKKSSTTASSQQPAASIQHPASSIQQAR